MDRMISGIPASPGFAVGEAYLLERGSITVEERTLEPDEIPAEIERFELALDQARSGVKALQKRIAQSRGEEGIGIFGVHLMILQDPMVVEETLIKETFAHKISEVPLIR